MKSAVFCRRNLMKSATRSFSLHPETRERAVCDTYKQHSLVCVTSGTIDYITVFLFHSRLCYI